MSDLDAAPSSTEPTTNELASIAMGGDVAQPLGGGGAAAGEPSVIVDTAVPTISPVPAVDVSVAADPTATGVTAPAIEPVISTEGSINLGAHLSRLDAMLAELERKIGTGIHLFAHEVTAAREHLAKLL